MGPKTVAVFGATAQIGFPLVGYSDGLQCPLPERGARSLTTYWPDYPFAYRLTAFSDNTVQASDLYLEHVCVTPAQVLSDQTFVFEAKGSTHG